MSIEVFTQRWAQAWADELRASAEYRVAALKWEGSLILELAADPDSGLPEDRAVFLDLWHGDCRSARIPDDFDQEEATYIIRAPAHQWKRVLAGEIEPVMGLMTGQLKLTRGSLARLMPYVKAAKELLATVARIPSHFPNGDSAHEAPPHETSPHETSPHETPAHETPAHETPAHEVPENILAGPGTASAVRLGGSPTEVDMATDDSAEADESTSATTPLGTPLPFPRVIQTTSPRGLNHDLPAMRLWHKAKRFGIWDPRGIDFTRDAEDWAKLEPIEAEILLHLASIFQAGEEAVTLDLLPLIMVIAREGRLEEEMYLASFLWEEAKHVELFRRFLDEVAQDQSDLSRFHSPSYRAIFYDKLPNALERLHHDPSPQAQAVASVTYNMVVEGVLAETGYHAYHQILVRNEILPGMQQAVSYLKSDEARHMAYGVFLLSRLVAEHGDSVWRVIERRMNELLPAAIGVIEETFQRYEVLPFGLTVEMFTDFATRQFQHRFERIERSRHQSLEEICRLPVEEPVS